MSYYCGLDLGSKSCHVCVIDEKGERLVDKKVPNRLERVTSLIAPFQKHLECVVESTFNWYWLVDGLRASGYAVCLAHTLGLFMITRAKVKTDRRDAYALARLLKADMIPKAYIYPRSMRPARDLVRHRCRLVRKRADCYGTLRRMLYQHGLLDHGCNSIKGVDDEAIERWFDHPLVRLHGRHELDQIRLYSVQIEEVEQQILAGVKARPAFKRLMEIPGIGAILAITLFFEIGDITRFPSTGDFSSYCRVVNGMAQSAEVVRRGRGGKQGNPYLKHALTEAAVKARRYYQKVQRFHDRCLERHTGRGRMLIANNAVAHKLCMAVYHVLRHEVKYREELLFGN